MTALVGILNRQAVAIAADSAVTMGNTHKVFNSGNKIFTLSKYHPVAIMTYNVASFMGIPWEIIIKNYRKQLGDIHKMHIEEYIEDFIKYVKKQKETFLTQDIQHENLFDQICAHYWMLFNTAMDKAQKLGSFLKENNFGDILYGFIKEEMNTLNEFFLKQETCEDFKDYSFDDFLKYAEVDFSKFFNRNNFNIPMLIPKTERKFFEENFYKFLISQHYYGAYTGLVFTGYGEDDIFPAIQAVNIYSVTDNRLKYYYDKHRSFKISNRFKSCIVPYAQTDVIDTIMSGIYPGFNRIIETVLSEMMNIYSRNTINFLERHSGCEEVANEIKKINIERLVKDTTGRMKSLMHNNYTSALVNTIINLDKADMANIAESFISLTSLIRRMSPHEETVGGPIDVAVISKGDGFIWINRKYYFKSEYNQHFFENYFKC